MDDSRDTYIENLNDCIGEMKNQLNKEIHENAEFHVKEQVYERILKQLSDKLTETHKNLNDTQKQLVETHKDLDIYKKKISQLESQINTDMTKKQKTHYKNMNEKTAELRAYLNSINDKSFKKMIINETLKRTEHIYNEVYKRYKHQI